ncbi:dihydrouridine synthase [Xylariaceae sp. FL0804]|nr:dihydrouridine synthase [Xylariaceae sp. FL0804]
MSLLLRAARAIMTSPVKNVPIPPRGVDYRGKVVLAPMVRSGELPSRLLALHYGADLVWGPETVDKSLIGTTRRFNPATGTVDFTRRPSHAPAHAPDSLIYRLHPGREGGRLVFQLGTADPALAVAAARVVAADVAGIDVNAGCPKSFSTHAGMGAALLRNPDLLCAILRALVAADLDVAVSVKIRLLPDARDTEALVRRLVATGVAGLTVHCRTPSMRPREPALLQLGDGDGQLPMVARLCRAAGVACLVNGDVSGRDAGLALAAEAGCDGAMIATAAERNPSCFRAGPDPLLPWQDVALRYVRAALDVENRFGNSKFTLLSLVPGKSPAGRRLQACKSYADVCDVLGYDDDETVARARAVDLAIGIDNDDEAAAGKKKQQQSGNKGKASSGSDSALAAGGQMAQSRRDASAQANKKALSERGVSARRETMPPPEAVAQSA